MCDETICTKISCTIFILFFFIILAVIYCWARKIDALCELKKKRICSYSVSILDFTQNPASSPSASDSSDTRAIAFIMHAVLYSEHMHTFSMIWEF